MTTLVLDASGARASVAVLRAGAVLAAGTATMRHRDRETLLPLVLDVVAQAGTTLAAIRQVVVGEGPGAFTSLRIAAATAKGLVHGTPTGLAAVPSLVLLAATAEGAGDRRLAVTDALRGERFVQPVVRGADGWADAAPVAVVPAEAVDALSARWNAVVVGPLHGGPDVPEAAALRHVAPTVVRAVDLAGWEPRYGRLAEAQVKWEAAAGHALPSPVGTVDTGAPPA